MHGQGVAELTAAVPIGFTLAIRSEMELCRFSETIIIIVENKNDRNRMIMEEHDKNMDLVPKHVTQPSLGALARFEQDSPLQPISTAFH